MEYLLVFYFRYLYLGLCFWFEILAGFVVERHFLVVLALLAGH